MIFGITGYVGSGKDTVADYLVEKKNFIHISLSDILRQDLKRQKKAVTRENLQEIGKDIRKLCGEGILAERALLQIEPEKNYVISSIGTVGEVIALEKSGKFVLIFVDAPIKQRFERACKRNREKDARTFEDFKKLEQKESKGGGSFFREFENVKKMARIIINNNSSLEKLYEKIEKVWIDSKKLPQFKRPSWDEYFMGIVDAVAQRATCDRGKTACVVVKDKRIIATGYVGSPIGLPHCDEEGHLMHKVLNTDGTVSQHCVRTLHAEQNAITQAAKYGISINGSTMYMKMEPCRACAMMIINSGIKRVVARKKYHKAQETREMFKIAGVKLDVLEDSIAMYGNM